VRDTHRADLPTWECYDLANTCSVGRLSFLDGDTPIAYPVSFKLHRTNDGSFLVIRTSADSLLAKYTGPSSFAVDDIDVESRTAWSVLFHGVLRQSHDSTNLPVPDPWIAEGRHVWLLLEIAAVTGRRFVARPSSEGYSVEWELVEHRPTKPA
jgi:uncharacterized protein